ncbi:hypothetical protein BDV19DRAFT_385343 [Aspergillus venezuelensis]
MQKQLNGAKGYIILEVILAIIIHIVPSFYVDAVATGMQGFFLGPLFPAIVVAKARLVSEQTYMSAIGVVAGFSSLGSTLLPLLIGIVTETRGVSMLQPLVIAFIDTVAESSAGIDARLAILLAKRDANAVVNYVAEGSMKRAQAAVDGITKIGTNAIPWQASVSNCEEILRLVTPFKRRL